RAAWGREEARRYSPRRSDCHRHLGSSTAGWSWGRADYSAERSAYFTFGFNNSCDRALFMFSLVMRLTPVSTVGSTFSPLDAARAVLTPSYPMRYGSWITSALIVPSFRNAISLESES